MNYQVHVPRAPLAACVEYLWSLEDVPAHGRESILPTGTLELVVNLAEDEIRVYDVEAPRRCRRFSGAAVSGAYRSAFAVDTLEHASIVGAHFRPGGAFPFFATPLGELTDGHVDLEALWGAAAGELRERLCAARTAAGRFRVLEEALVARLGRARPRHRSVPVVLDELERGESSVGALASRVGLSRRRLIEVFTAEVGMTPKRFARVRRFQRTLVATRRDPAPDWVHVALACGYYDQSHLIRDFVSLAGLSPAALARRRSDAVKEHHVVMPAWVKSVQYASVVNR
jgi:AraC-like DNA-binding protein